MILAKLLQLKFILKSSLPVSSAIKLERRLWVELSFELKAVMENVHWIVKELVFQGQSKN
jgi:hypothetical protein